MKTANGRRRYSKGATADISPALKACTQKYWPIVALTAIVEAVIQAATNNDDYAPFEELLTVLSKPYEDQPRYAAYADPPLPDQRVLRTFCGT